MLWGIFLFKIVLVLLCPVHKGEIERERKKSEERKCGEREQRERKCGEIDR